MTGLNYKQAGVNIQAANEAMRRIKGCVERTFSPRVLNSLGGFGALYDLKEIAQNYQHPVLVQSIDGVGTKMIVARMMKKFDTIGYDLVSATANDIVVLGAKPLTLLDYIANDKLKPAIIEQIVSGIARACEENDISLVGGETAEMPDTYLAGEFDLVGIVTGVVEKERTILGHNIAPGDQVLAFASSGLHTNGYSLARKLLFDVGGYSINSKLIDLKQTVGETLLTPHLNYTRPVQHLLHNNIAIKGMAHITGGGMLENIPRILPAGCAVTIHKAQCPSLPIFAVLRGLGKLKDAEMYRTFNMGVGLVMIVAPETLSALQSTIAAFPDFPVYHIGEVVTGARDVTLV